MPIQYNFSYLTPPPVRFALFISLLGVFDFNALDQANRVLGMPMTVVVLLAAVSLHRWGVENFVSDLEQPKQFTEYSKNPETFL